MRNRLMTLCLAAIALLLAGCGVAERAPTPEATVEPSLVPSPTATATPLAVPSPTATAKPTVVEPLLGVDFSVNSEEIGQYERFEITFPFADIRCHPDDLDIVASFTSLTGGEIRVGGFAYHGEFKVRFAPQELGTYHYLVTADDGSGVSTVAKGALSAVPSKSRGFLRVSDRHPHQLVFDDGTHFYILGENRINIYDFTWNYKFLHAPDYIKYMSENGLTTLRFFVYTDAEDENAHDLHQKGCLEPVLGRYDEGVADVFDEIMEAAEQYGVYVIPTVFAVGFTPGDPWKDWHDNPYYSGRGGPCERNTEFFVNPTGLEFQRKKLRYMLARWGYSTHLLALDIYNEPEWDHSIGESIWTPWGIDTANYLHDIDPYGHMVTIGPVGPTWKIDADEEDWYGSEACDLVQWHLYGVYDPYYNARKMASLVKSTRVHKKPVFCGEFAWGGEDKETYDHTHNGIWSAIMSGGGALAHSAPAYNVETDELMTPERARHFRVLASFLEGVEWDRGLQPSREAILDPSSMQIWMLGTENYRLLWLLGPISDYGGSVDNAMVTVTDVADGSYTVEWWDDVSGEVVASETVTAVGQELKLDVPPFVRHIAAKIHVSESG